MPIRDVKCLLCFCFWVQGCEHGDHGAAGDGVRSQDVLRQEHHRRHPVFPLQQAVQDEEERLHRLQAASSHAG